MKKMVWITVRNRKDVGDFMQTFRLVKAEKLRRMVVYTFYVMAVITLLYFWTAAVTYEEGMQYVFILLVIPAGIYSEVLRFLYARASDILHEKCDAGQCVVVLEKFEKLDFMHLYRKSTDCLKGCAYLDLNRMQEVESIVAGPGENTEAIKKKMDFEYQYLAFLYAGTGKDRKKLEEHYGELCRIFSVSRNKSSDMEAMYGLIKGIYLYWANRSGEAEAILERLDYKRLKKHEQVYYFYYYACALKKENKKKRSEEVWKEGRCMAKKMPYIGGKLWQEENA